MTRNTKIILGVLAAVLAVCGLGCGIATFAAGRFASSAMVTSPEGVRTMSAEIADYTLPAGFNESVGMNMIIVKMVMHVRAADGALIMMMALPSGNANDADFQRGIDQGLRNSGGRSVRWESSREVTVTIAGKPVRAVEQVGVTDDGQRMKSLAASFTAAKGLAMTMVMMPESKWNQAEVDAFLASIR